MRKKSVFLFLMLLLFAAPESRAQLTLHKLLHAGYVHQNQSFGEVGGKILLLKTDDVIYRVGASALLGSVNGQFAALPKVQGDVLLNFERNVDFYHAYYFLAGAEVTTKYVAPKIGVTLFGLLDLSGGYAFSLDDAGFHGKKLEGLNLNCTLNIPIVVFGK